VLRGDGGKLKREIGQLILGCAAAALLVTSALQWLSWHWLSQSQRYVAELAVTGWIADEQAWHRHREALEARRDLVPLSANVYWQLGELHRWRAMGMRLWPEQQRQELEAAKQQYIQAVVRSPFNGELLARVADRLAMPAIRWRFPCWNGRCTSRLTSRWRSITSPAWACDSGMSWIRTCKAFRSHVDSCHGQQQSWPRTSGESRATTAVSTLVDSLAGKDG
jgi:hypothetical protein